MLVKQEDYAANPAFADYFNQITTIELPEPVRILREIRLAVARLELLIHTQDQDDAPVFKAAVLTVLAIAENELIALLERQHSHWANGSGEHGLGFVVFESPHPFQRFLWTEELSGLFHTAFYEELDHDMNDVINDVYFYYPANSDPKREDEIMAAGGASYAELLESAKAKLPKALVALARTPSFRSICRELGFEVVDTIFKAEPPAAEPPVDNDSDLSNFRGLF